MDIKIFFAAFCTIFLAELGDKTQLANLSLSAKSGSLISVVTGSILAFAAVTIITVLLGGFISRTIKPEYIRIAAGSLFIILGVLMFAGKL